MRHHTCNTQTQIRTLFPGTAYGRLRRLIRLYLAMRTPLAPLGAYERLTPEERRHLDTLQRLVAAGDHA